MFVCSSDENDFLPCAVSTIVALLGIFKCGKASGAQINDQSEGSLIEHGANFPWLVWSLSAFPIMDLGLFPSNEHN
jgi:hypothetical protein